MLFVIKEKKVSADYYLKRKKCLLHSVEIGMYFFYLTLTKKRVVQYD